MDKYQEKLRELENKKLQEKAAFLDKKNYCSEFGSLVDFNPEDYEDRTFGNGYKGCNLYVKGTEMILARPVETEAEQAEAGEADTKVAYEGVILEQVSDADYEALKAAMNPRKTVNFVMFIVLSVFTAFAFVTSWYVFFEAVSSGAVTAFFYFGLLFCSFMVGLSTICLLLKKRK